jgi:hypothetical protein
MSEACKKDMLDGDQSCALCNRAFQQKSELEAHMLIHNHENSFICDVCERSFIDQNSLRKHFLHHGRGRESLFSHGRKGTNRKRPDYSNVTIVGLP